MTSKNTLTFFLVSLMGLASSASAADCYRHTVINCFYIQVGAMGAVPVCLPDPNDADGQGPFDVTYGSANPAVPDLNTRSIEQCGLTFAPLPAGIELRPNGIADALFDLVVILVQDQIQTGDPCGGFISEAACLLGD